MSGGPGNPLAHDLLLAVRPEAHRYAVHAALDERWGRRGQVRFLWTLGVVEGGRAARVRLPFGHPDGKAGLDLHAPPKGVRLGFRLCANITQKDQETGRRRSWARDAFAQRQAWLERRASTHGFKLEAVRIEVSRCHIRKGHGFWLDETWFTGTLAVTDATAFASALVSGVGQRGAFGFGLLETFDPALALADDVTLADAT